MLISLMLEPPHSILWSLPAILAIIVLIITCVDHDPLYGRNKGSQPFENLFVRKIFHIQELRRKVLVRLIVGIDERWMNNGLPTNL